MFERKPVVLAQTFNVARFETGGLGASHRVPDRREKMVRKHVALHKRAAGTLGDAQRAHNRVMEKLSTGPEQLVSSEEVIIK